MINRAEMGRPKEKELPILGDQEVQNILRSRIDAIRRNVERPIRFGYFYHIMPFSALNEKDDHRELFFFTSEEFSFFENGKVESDRLQRLGFEIMRGYGLDENISQPAYTNNGYNQNEVNDYSNGISVEVLDYPSQTINGLIFQRIREFVTATGKTLSVDWEAVDKAPVFRIKKPF